MDYEELREIGVLLNGGNTAGWKQHLADVSGKGFSTIRRWATNPETIPPSSENHLKALAEKVRQDLQQIGLHKLQTLDLPVIDINKLTESDKHELKLWCLNILKDI